jgi:hypothetical protein
MRSLRRVKSASSEPATRDILKRAVKRLTGFERDKIVKAIEDEQVRRLRKLSNTEKNQEIAASKAGMDPAIVPAARASATTETANSARSVRNI